jgi:hypothetical protein
LPDLLTILSGADFWQDFGLVSRAAMSRFSSRCISLAQTLLKGAFDGAAAHELQCELQRARGRRFAGGDAE